MQHDPSADQRRRGRAEPDLTGNRDLLRPKLRASAEQAEDEERATV
jgi:hypothetical protein